jgi:hypothetical protein
MLPSAIPMPSFELKAMANGPGMALWFTMTELGATFPFALSANSLIVPPVPAPSFATRISAGVDFCVAAPVREEVCGAPTAGTGFAIEPGCAPEHAASAMAMQTAPM